MKVSIEYDLGMIEIDTNTGHGSIDGVWIDGIECSEMSVVEMIYKIISQQKWSRLLEEAEYKQRSAYNSPDRMEDEYGVPV